MQVDGAWLGRAAPQSPPAHHVNRSGYKMGNKMRRETLRLAVGCALVRRTDHGMSDPDAHGPRAEKKQPRILWLERFHNSRALFGIFKGGFFLMKKPLGNFGSGARQL